MKTLLKELQQEKKHLEVSQETYSLVSTDGLKKAMKNIESKLDEKVKDTEQKLSSIIGETRTNISKELGESRDEIYQSLDDFSDDVESIRNSLAEISDMRSEDFEILEKSLNEIQKKVNSISEKGEKSVSDIQKSIAKFVKESISPIEEKIQSIGKESNNKIIRHSHKYDEDIVQIYNKFKSLEEIIGKIPKDIYEFGSQLYVNSGGKLVGITSLINFVSGFTVVPNGLGIDITALGGGGSGSGLTIIQFLGTIDDVNTTFTISSFVQSLTQIVINGIPYNQTGGAITWSFSGLTVTISSPIGLGGSIFGIGLSFTQLTTMGTIDDVNTVFFFSQQPTLLDINGAYYQQTGGAITWTWTGSAAILSVPVGSGGSISGLI